MDAWSVVALLVAVPVGYLLCRLVASVVRFYTTLQSLKRMPHVSGRGLFGWTGMLDDMTHMPHVLAKVAEENGGLFSFRTLHIMGVVVTDPALAQQVMSTLDLPKEKNIYHILNTLTSPDGAHPNLLGYTTHDGYWRLVRRGVAPAFSPKHIRAEFPHVLELTNQICDILAAAELGSYLDMSALLQRESMDVIGRIGFSCDFGSLRAYQQAQARAKGKRKQSANGAYGSSDIVPDDVLAVVRAGASELVKRFTNPLRYPLRRITPDGRRGERVMGAVHAINWHLLKEIKARGEPAPSDMSIAAHLLRIRDPKTGLPLSDEQLASEIGVFFSAGFETTANTMSWFMYLLAQHPEVEAKVCTELDALGLLVTQERPNPRQLQYEDLSKLKYLGMVIKESMRLVPVAGGGTVRVSDRPIVLGGYAIPAGVQIGVPLHGLMNDKRNWERPDEFLPERWEAPGAEYWYGPVSSMTNGPTNRRAKGGPAAPAGQGPAGDHGLLENEEEEEVSKGDSDTRPPRRFLPFNTGLRSCIGQNLAKMSYTATLAVLVSRYSFELPEELRGPGALWDMQCYRTTTQPRNGLPMKPIPRAVA